MSERLPQSRHSTPAFVTAVRPRKVRLLVIEDNPDDQELVRRMLRTATDLVFEVDVAPRLSDALERLTANRYDAALVDLTLPDSRGVETIRRVNERAPELPLIALTGQDDVPTELATLAIGAQDYLIKGQDDARVLMRTIRHSMERKRLENERTLLSNQLKKALADVRTLSGLLPVCVNCKSVRDDTGYWEQIDLYIRNNTDAQVSHGICPECTKKIYPELSEPPAR